MRINDEVLYDVLFDCGELFDFDEFDLESEELIDAIRKIERLSIRIPKNKIFSEESLEQLNMLLKHASNLKTFDILNDSGNSIDISSIFENISSSIERITIRNENLSNGINQENMDKLTNLVHFQIMSSDIAQLPVLPNKDATIWLKGVPALSNESLIEYGKEHKVFVTDNEELNKVLNILRGDNNLIPLDLYFKYKDVLGDRDLCISIKDASQLDLDVLETLKENPNIKHIHIEGGCYGYDSNNTLVLYTIQEYADVRTKIDKIISQVELPDEIDEDREKKIFAQIYKILGESISYDYYAISNEGKKDLSLAFDCRTLKNGLCGVERNGKKENICVCAGYADILRNISACLGISCEYISSYSSEELVFQNGAYVEKIDEKGKKVYQNGTNDPMGHAYNLVKLDGEYYYVDLTWDIPYIQAHRFPLPNFLKSAAEFEESHKNVGFGDRHYHDAPSSLSINKQAKLFGDEISFKVGELESMISEGYLSGFVSEYLGVVQNGRNSISPGELLEMMGMIKAIEDHILRRENISHTNMSVNIGKGKSFIFDTSDPQKLNKMKEDIRKRREERGEFGEY